MSRLKKKIANGLATVFALGDVLAFFGAVILFLFLFAKAMQPLSPIITMLVVFGFTVHALASGKVNAVGVLTGLVIYGLSWPTAFHYGVPLGMSVWAIGVLLWLVAVTRSFPRVWAAFTA